MKQVFMTGTGRKRCMLAMYDSVIEAARVRYLNAIDLGATSVLNFPEL